MKRIIVKLVLVMLCFTHLSVSAYTKFGKVEETTIESKVLDEKRELVVYLPAGYEADMKSYPVLYMTDGDIQGPHTAGSIDYLSKFDQMPNMIVVGLVNPRDKRNNDLTLAKVSKEQPENTAGADRFLAFVEKEVIPFIKSRYRTLDYQALSGTSHGGQFAINALIKKPHLFDGVIAISPSLYWNNNQLLGLMEQALTKQTLKGRLFMSIADEQPIMTESFQAFVDLTNKYPLTSLNLVAETFTNESHDSTTLLGQYYGLKHLFSGWAIPSNPQTLTDLQAIYDARSTMLGKTMLIPEDRANGYGQWLQYLGRQDDALDLFTWNRQTYPQSISAHKALIQAYLHFKLVDAAAVALEEAIKSVKGLTSEQKEELTGLFT